MPHSPLSPEEKARQAAITRDFAAIAHHFERAAQRRDDERYAVLFAPPPAEGERRGLLLGLFHAACTHELTVDQATRAWLDTLDESGLEAVLAFVLSHRRWPLRA